MFLGMIAITIAVFVHELTHRIFGLEQGFDTEFKPFFYGLVAGLVLTFMSYGIKKGCQQYGPVDGAGPCRSV